MLMLQESFYFNEDDRKYYKIPLSHGLDFALYYDDGTTPIPDKKITLRSHIGNEIGSRWTNFEGITSKFWVAPTLEDGEYYEAVAHITDDLTYTYPKIVLSPSGTTTINMITPYPEIFESKISIKLLALPDSINLNNFEANLYRDSSIAAESLLVKKNNSFYFSNLGLGSYDLIVSDGVVEILNTNILIDGKKTDWEFSIKKFQNNTIKNSTITPAVMSKNESCDCVVFRLDNVKDNWLNNVQISIIETFQKNNVPLTLGVDDTIGEDQKLVSAIQTSIADPTYKLEIANQAQESNPLDSYTSDEQKQILEHTNDKIYEVFKIRPTAYITNTNYVNQDTLDVLEGIGIQSITFDPLLLKTELNYGIDTVHQNVRLGYQDENTKMFNLKKTDLITDSIRKNIKDDGYVVVKLTPQSFAAVNDGNYLNKADPDKITKLISLLEYLKNHKINMNSLNEVTTVTNLSNSDSEINYKTISCNCVAFRLDDIQDFFLTNIQMELVETFQKNNVDLTVGVIANEIGRDIEMTEFVSNMADDPNIEFANHGWEHEDFSQFGTVGQEMLLLRANDKISEMFGVTPTVFIPPLNAYNSDTISALHAQGFTHFSSELDFATPPFPLSDQTLYHFPETAFTGDLNEQRTRFVGMSADYTFNQIQNSLKEYGFAVVTLHPQEFAQYYNNQYQNKVDYQQIEQLELLFSKIEENNINTVLLNEINIKPNEKQLVPQWVKNNAQWWIEDKVSTEEFVNSLEFLISKRIIMVPDTESTSSLTNIPEWVKTNIQWWTEGQTSDSEFISATQFLIKNGIIQI